MTTTDTHTITTPTTNNPGSCSGVAWVLAVLVLIIGGVSANIGHARFGDVGTDWMGFSLVVGAAAICLTIGQCAAAICRQLAGHNS